MGVKRYRKKGVIEAYQYRTDFPFSLEGIYVSENDDPSDGGWIAYDPDNPSAQWFINKDYFAKHYEEA